MVSRVVNEGGSACFSRRVPRRVQPTLAVGVLGRWRDETLVVLRRPRIFGDIYRDVW